VTGGWSFWSHGLPDTALIFPAATFTALGRQWRDWKESHIASRWYMGIVYGTLYCVEQEGREVEGELALKLERLRTW
jgi:hypothetical protein